jgi:small subunit ribosomal protein S19
MTRSLWKGPFVDTYLIKNIVFLQEKNTKRLKIWSRRSYVLPQFVGHTVEVHNGKDFISLEITEQMIGHKFGEFAMTRKRALHKKKDKRKK